MNFRQLTALITAACALAAPASACYKVSLTNETQADLAAAWYAVGCDFYLKEHRCHHAAIPSGDTAHYSYDLSTVAPELKISIKGKDLGETRPDYRDLTMTTVYTLHHGVFAIETKKELIPESATGCHSAYSIKLTQEKAEELWATFVASRASD